MRDAFAIKVEKLQLCDPQSVSFFDLIESIWKTPNKQPFHRFCTLMRKMNARSYVREDLVLNQELLDEREMLRIHLKSDVDLKAERLTFFASVPESLRWKSLKKLPDIHLLGYAIIVKVIQPGQSDPMVTYMLEAVVRPSSVVALLPNKEIFIESITNYYLHNSKSFQTILGTRKYVRIFTLKGSFFTQQNSLTSVCAHAALRIAVNSSSMLDVPKLTNKAINDILKIRKYNPGVGLNQKQMEKVVRKLGLHFHSANFLENTAVEYDHFMYPSLESGFPTILGMERWDDQQHKLVGHVVTVLGHTMNSDRWEPEARRGYGSYPLKVYIPTAEWCCHYIISDDNYGIHSTLPSDAIRNFIVPTKNPNHHVTMAISIVPKEVALPGYFAEQLAISKAYLLINSVRLTTPCKWHDRMKGANIVCRTSLARKNDYINFIRKCNKNLTQEQDDHLNGLPEYLWISEMSLPNIFTGNKHKLGDVVIRANANRREHRQGKSLALAWFPGFIQLGHALNIKPWGIDTHVPLLRSSDPPLLEW